ncbi:TIGR00266 family protein, partial [filamentous cyanobacterium CCP5]
MPAIAYDIEHSPAYAMLRLTLQPHQQVIVESGAMAAMDTSITMRSKATGGFMGGLGRMLGGEAFFVSEFTAQNKPGQLFVSPA